MIMFNTSKPKGTAWKYDPSIRRERTHRTTILHPGTTVDPLAALSDRPSTKSERTGSSIMVSRMQSNVGGDRTTSTMGGSRDVQIVRITAHLVILDGEIERHTSRARHARKAHNGAKMRLHEMRAKGLRALASNLEAKVQVLQSEISQLHRASKVSDDRKVFFPFTGNGGQLENRTLAASMRTKGREDHKHGRLTRPIA